MKKLIAICLIVVLSFFSSPLIALVQFKDGQVNNINFTVNDDVWVDFQSPGVSTTVNLLAGGNIPLPYKLQGHNDSRLNISGGTVYGLFTYNTSQVIMSDGYVSDLYAYDSSQITMSGGSVGPLNTYGSSQAIMLGGLGHVLRAHDNSQLTLSGGIIDSYLFSTDNAELIINGSNFAIDGIPVGFGEITSILGGYVGNEPSRRITGTLANGDAINNQFQVGYSASINLIPEPATISLLALGFLLLRRKK